ncbi:MAG: AAA family ATPase, partial [Microthrixaceae bacterium]|nr:AAA family ATPase [Microthrixaceae bacterium]
GRPPDPDDAARYRRLGFAPDDERSLPLELTAPELWALCAHLHARVAGDPAAMTGRAAEVAARLRLDPPPVPLRAHSHGMRRKAQLVAALLHDPPLVVLDEPTNGLDPLAAQELGRLLAEHAGGRGAGVLATTHDLLWALRFADVLTVLAGGEIRFSGPPTDLLPTDLLASAAEAFDELADGLR